LIIVTYKEKRVGRMIPRVSEVWSSVRCYRDVTQGRASHAGNVQDIINDECAHTASA
jgi:hypothetical protein